MMVGYPEKVAQKNQTVLRPDWRSERGALEDRTQSHQSACEVTRHSQSQPSPSPSTHGRGHHLKKQGNIIITFGACSEHRKRRPGFSRLKSREFISLTLQSNTEFWVSRGPSHKNCVSNVVTQRKTTPKLFCPV